MAHAIVQDGPGGPEVLRWAEVAVEDPGPGEVRLRHTAVGVNFIDVYHRRGNYPVPTYPLTIGAEAVGVVEAVRAGVTGIRTGDRVGYASRTAGSHAEARVVPADWLVKLPDDLPDDIAATIMLKGMTAEYLLHRTHAVRTGDTMVVHAAAGGMGTLLCEWGQALGAHVLGTVSTPTKADIARAHGCTAPILYLEEDFVARVRELTGGRGADVVYDGVGKDTFEKSVDALGEFGHLVSYGQASGPIAPMEIARLAARSLTVSRPSLFHYTADATRRARMAERLFSAIRRGDITPEVSRRYALKDAAEAHRALENRETTGSIVLVP